MTLALQAEGIPQPRESAWADDEANQAFPDELREVIAQTIEDGVSHDRPQVVEVSQAREIVGQPLVAAQNGDDVAAAAEEAARKLTELIETTE
jgi:multiple sugar transport system substrate-binding protein